MTLHKTIWCDKGWQPVHIAFIPSPKAWRKECKRLGIPNESYPTSQAQVTYLTGTDTHEQLCLVTLNKESAKDYDNIQIIALLVHEAVHVFQFVREVMGEKEPSVEFEAYSIQSISQSLLDAYEKTRGKLTK